MSPVCEQDAFFPFCLYHCLFSVCALTDRCLRLANAMCVCLNLHGLQLKISSVCYASKWELHAPCSVVWSRGGKEQLRRKRERGRGEWSRWETKGEKGFACTGNSPRTARAHLWSGKCCIWNKKTQYVQYRSGGWCAARLLKVRENVT